MAGTTKDRAKQKKEKSSSFRSLIWYGPQIVTVILGTGAAFVLGLVKGFSVQELLQILCFTALGFGIMGLAVRLHFPYHPLDPKIDSKHLGRFWITALIALTLSALSLFLPNTTWLFLPVYVILGLYSSPLIGAVAGTVFLTFTTLLTGAGVGVFFLYLLSGIFGILVFLPIRKDQKLVLPFCLSLGFLWVCELGGILLTINARLSIEQLLLPSANLVISALLLLAGTRVYVSRELYRDRDLFLYLNDTEHPKLVAMRNEDKKGYLQSIHTAYFCERIASSLGMDGEVLKCVGYYHRLTPLTDPARQDFYDEMQFTSPVRAVLNEFTDYAVSKSKRPIVTREAAVLLCSQTVITSILNMYEKGAGSIDSDAVIDAIFKRFEESRVFMECDISVREMVQMRALFKKEKLYYDFLR
jgi:hypothetical protein